MGQLWELTRQICLPILHHNSIPLSPSLSPPLSPASCVCVCVCLSHNKMSFKKQTVKTSNWLSPSEHVVIVMALTTSQR